jgi:preprotein translocase subunit YajC
MHQLAQGTNVVLAGVVGIITVVHQAVQEAPVAIADHHVVEVVQNEFVKNSTKRL